MAGENLVRIRAAAPENQSLTRWTSGESGTSPPPLERWTPDSRALSILTRPWLLAGSTPWKRWRGFRKTLYLPEKLPFMDSEALPLAASGWQQSRRGSQPQYELM